MNKNKRLVILFGVLGVAFMIAGFTFLFLGTVDTLIDPQTSKTTILLCKIFGGVGLIGGLLFILAAMLCFFRGDKRLEVEEKDERNIAIRGKAAQAALFVISILFFILTFVCLMMDLILVAILISATLLIGSFTQMLLIGYYQKKM